MTTIHTITASTNIPQNINMRQMSIPAEASSITPSMPKASKVIERAAIPAPIATPASTTIHYRFRYFKSEGFPDEIRAGVRRRGFGHKRGGDADCAAAGWWNLCSICQGADRRIAQAPRNAPWFPAHMGLARIGHATAPQTRATPRRRPPREACDARAPYC